MQRDTVAPLIQPAIGDPFLAQCGPDISAERFQPLLHHARHIHFEQQVGPTLKIQAEIDGRTGQPSGYCSARPFGQKIRKGEKEPEEKDREDGQCLPAADVNH